MAILMNKKKKQTQTTPSYSSKNMSSASSVTLGSNPYENIKKPKNDLALPITQPQSNLKYETTPAASKTSQTKGLRSPTTGRTPEESFMKSDTPTVFRNRDGTLTGAVEFPDGRVFSNLSAKQIQALVDSWYNKTRIEGSDTYGALPEDLSIERYNEMLKDVEAKQFTQGLVENVGVLTPEQEALANSNPILSDDLNPQALMTNVGRSLLKESIQGAGVGLLAKGTPVGAIAGVAGGTALGSAKATFAAYDAADKYNFDKVSNNVQSAQDNMQAAITLAKKGLGDESRIYAVKKYNEGLAQLRLAERQMYELSKDDQNAYINDVRLKLTEIEDFKKDIRPQMDIEMIGALQSPDKKYIDENIGE